MATENETPSRVKKLLSSFLSTLSQTTANENVLSSDKPDSRGSFTNVEDATVPDARNKKLFYDRVETFSPLTWFAKPLDLSPLMCARYGWENVEYDMLQCVNCKAFLCGQLPKAVDTQVYRDSCNKLKKNLTESHEKLCKWSSSPCPDSFLCVPFHDREELNKHFWFRVTSLHCARIPLISYTSIEEKGASKENMCVYAETIRCNNESQRDTALDVIVCALCGWLYSETQRNILQCSLCRRKIGLWNYNNEDPDEVKQVHINDVNKEMTPANTSINGQCVKENNSTVKHSNGNGESSGCENESSVEHSRKSLNGSKDGDGKDVEGNDDEPERKRPRLEKQSFDPVAEHRYWCPWLQTKSLNTSLEKIQSQESSPNTSPEKLPVSSVGQSSLTQKPSDYREPAWLLVTKILSHTSDDDFHRQMKQSPQVEGLRQLRKVLKQCTSPTSPTKLPKL